MTKNHIKLEKKTKKERKRREKKEKEKTPRMGLSYRRNLLRQKDLGTKKRPPLGGM